ncbi:MAG TPA: hypothetical protein VLW50_27240 [Streptosporangiaceae bacterium]|nr:hypothetical protein [Streptosporangiaceae bacterium]
MKILNSQSPPRRGPECIFPAAELAPHLAYLIDVDTVGSDFTTGDPLQVGERFGEQFGAETGIVLGSHGQELILGVPPAGEDRGHVQEVPRCRAVEQRIHLPGDGVIWVQHGADVQHHRRVGPPEHAQIKLAGMPRGVTDLHLHQVISPHARSHPQALVII